jgi:hypothetical protein
MRSRESGDGNKDQVEDDEQDKLVTTVNSLINHNSGVEGFKLRDIDMITN